MAAPPLLIDPVLIPHYQDLFGLCRVNGRQLRADRLIAELSQEFEEEFRALARERRRFLEDSSHPRRACSFLSPQEEVEDADGRRLSVARIRQGMLDHFLGRPSRLAWRLRPLPPDAVRPGLQGTGPFDDLGMAISALNAGTASWMADWEDAGNDYQDKLYQAWHNLRDLLQGRWQDRPYFHPLKGKEYRLRRPPQQWPSLFVRIPGLHLRSRQLRLQGKPVPAAIPALVLHALHNFEALRGLGSGVYYYVPKLETPREALLLARLLKRLEERIGVPRGTLRIEILNERARHVLAQEAILWVLRDWMIGPNVGRWDYLNSRIEMGRRHPELLLPDPHRVGMAEASMTAYTRRNALLTLLVAGFPIGGMSAVMKNPRQPEEVNRRAVRSIWFDKLRERLSGLFLFQGRLYDTYRQSWVATTEQEYVRAGEQPLLVAWEPGGGPLQELLQQTTPEERELLRSLGLVDGEGRITPLELQEKDLLPGHLFAPERWQELFQPPAGDTSEEGLRYAIYMASEYMFQLLNGNFAAAIDDYRTGNRLMNDLATYEIFWHWLWTVCQQGARLTCGGESTRAGEPVTPELVRRLLAERRAQVEKFFREQDRQEVRSRFDRSQAPLVMEILERQILHPRWIMYGSRLLLSLLEQPLCLQRQLLEAVFSPSREALLEKVQQGELPPQALEVFDYVYDIT